MTATGTGELALAFERDADEVLANLSDRVQRFAGKTVLLTGAAGFLGSQFVHVFARLNDSGILASPCRLLAFDNYLRGVPAWLKAMEARDDIDVRAADIVATVEVQPSLPA